jgi:hypothetical protein
MAQAQGSAQTIAAPTSLETALLSVGTRLNGIQFRRRSVTRRSNPSSPRSCQTLGLIISRA